MELCLFAAGALIRLGALALTLSWTHSVEKAQWQEDLRLGPAGIAVTEARVTGSGAGMEPPPDARFEAGFWRWRPNRPPLASIVLRRSRETEDWTVCVNGECRRIGELAPAQADPVTIAACP